jgi:hypothetical protein
MQHFHVAGVGRGAIENFRGERHPAHLLGAECVVEIGKPGAAVFAVVVVLRGRQEQVPEPFGPRLLLQLLDDGDDFPALAFIALGGKGADGRIDMRVHEGDDAVAPVLLPLRYREIHGVPSPFGIGRPCVPCDPAQVRRFAFFRLPGRKWARY